MNKFKFTGKIAAAAAALALAVGIFLMAGSTVKAVEATNAVFSCSVTDGNGQTVFGYYAPQDGIWYLFVPSTVDIRTMQVNYTGIVTAVSKGTLDPVGQVISGAFRNSGDTVALEVNGIPVTLKVMKSSLPSIQLRLIGTNLATVQKDKNVKYKNNSVVITDAAGRLSVASAGVEFKGRGNSTWVFYDKKGYQIKFDDKTSVLGMKEAKKWVLLANASDDSMLRNKLAFSLAKNLGMTYVTSYEYADLWIDGIYQGNYIVGEKVEIGSNRLNLKNEYGVLIEQDYAFYNEEDHWFYDEIMDTHFALKEAVEDKDPAHMKLSMEMFHASLDKFLAYLYTTPADQVTMQQLSAMIDVDSFAKNYLMIEYLLNREANNTSCYWYMDGPGDVLHMGPVWDFDTSMGNDGCSVTDSYGAYFNPVLSRLLSVPGFRDYVNNLKSKNNYRLRALPGEADKLARSIGSSAQMNYIRWNTLGGPNPKGGVFNPTWEASVDSVKTWLAGRVNGFNTAGIALSMSYSEDGQTVILTAGSQTPNLRIAFWKDGAPTDSVLWLDPTSVEKGKTTYLLPVTCIMNPGTYNFHLYAGPQVVGSITCKGLS